MEATIFTGFWPEDNREHYQLEIGGRLSSAVYNGAEERDFFLAKISGAFLRTLSSRMGIDTLNFVNGGRINEETRDFEEVFPLKTESLDKFVEILGFVSDIRDLYGEVLYSTNKYSCSIYYSSPENFTIASN